MVRRFMMGLSMVAVLSMGGVALDAQAGGGDATKAAAIPTGAKEVTTEQLKAMVASKTVQIYDARSKEAFDKSHVDGAVSLPVDKFDASKLPSDKASAIAFYCGGPACTLAPAAAKKALEAGYTNVLVYHEGIEGWNKSVKKS